MRYLEIVRRGDHLEICPAQSQTETFHRILKRSGVPLGMDGVAEAIERSEITGEPFEVPPAPGTGPAKKAVATRHYSYGINDMARADTQVCNEGEMAYLSEMGQSKPQPAPTKAKPSRTRARGASRLVVKDAELLASLRQDREAILAGQRGGSFAGMSLEQITAMLRSKG